MNDVKGRYCAIHINIWVSNEFGAFKYGDVEFVISLSFASFHLISYFSSGRS